MIILKKTGTGNEFKFKKCVLSQEVARRMVKSKYGKIINIASLLTFSGGLTVPSYSASKGAVGQITKALANEWACNGICVNAIAPGYIKTSNTKPIRDDKKRFKTISIASEVVVGDYLMI